MDRKALARATESSDAPTPGYLYIDIAKSVSISPKVCQDTIQYLLKRLQNKNHNIKYKTLKVISKVVDHPQYGGHQFKQSISTNPEFIAAIRDASTFRGPPDPLRGMTIYEQVHEAAKEALASIYSDSGPSNNGGVGGGGMNSGGGGFGGGIGGGGGMAPGMSTSYGNPISSNGYNHHGAMGSSTGGMSMGGTTRMEGIGNPNFSDPRLASQSNGEGGGGVRGSLRNMTVSQVIGNVQETVVNMVKDPLARNVQNMSSTNGGGSTSHSSELPGYGRPSLGSPPGRSQLSAATNGQWTMASNRGPNAIQPPGSMGGGYDPQRDAYQREKEMSYGNNRPQPLPNHNNFAPVNGSVFGSWGKPAGGGGGAGAGSHHTTTMQSSQYHHHNPPSSSYTSGSGGTAVSDGSYERNLIAELCPPGGMKAEPPIDKMEQFERNVSRLNSDLVCPVLLDQLEDGTPWIVKAKTLVVIYRTIRATSHLNPNPYADFFHACIEEIQPLANHPRTAIRDPAQNVLKELGVEIVQQQDNGNVEETNGGVASSTTVASSVPPSSSASATQNVVDLLDFSAGISDDQNVPPPPPETQPPPPPPAAVDNSTTNGTSTMSSLFGGLTVQDNRSSTKVNGSTTTSTSTNLLDDGNVLQETLGDVSNQNTASSQDPLSLGGGGGMKSGFGFLNGGTMNAAAPSTTTTTMTEPRDPPTSSHTPPSNNNNNQDKFDPLLSLDWNSSNATGGPQQHQQHNGGNHYYNMMQQHQHHQQPMMMMNTSTATPVVVMSPPKPGLGFNLNNTSELMTGTNAAGMMGSYNTMNSPTRNGSSMIRTTSMGHNGMGGIQQQTILVQSPKHHHHNNVTSTTGGGANSFSFYMNEMAEKKKQQDQSFDFIKDAMKTKK